MSGWGQPGAAAAVGKGAPSAVCSRLVTTRRARAATTCATRILGSTRAACVAGPRDVASSSSASVEELDSESDGEDQDEGTLARFQPDVVEEAKALALADKSDSVPLACGGAGHRRNSEEGAYGVKGYGSSSRRSPLDIISLVPEQKANREIELASPSRSVRQAVHTAMPPASNRSLLLEGCCAPPPGDWGGGGS